jgi:acyl-CoA synthetase (AMP-forming)/AMP-acid ligase II
MHVFLLPYLAVGATGIILDAPDGDRLFDLIEAGRADSLFAPPTVWIALANRPDFPTRDLSGLRKAYYGASIMPVPVLERLRERLPKLAFYNCFGPPGHRPRARRTQGADGLLRPACPLRRRTRGRRGGQGRARRHAR